MRKTMLACIMILGVVGAANAADDAIPHRLARAKVGEWVLLRDVSGDRAGETTKFSVTEVKGSGDEAIVVLKKEEFDRDGKAADTKDIEIPIARYNTRIAGLEDKAKQISRERLMVKDKEITVVAVTWDDEENSRELKIWVSDEIPTGGIVKTWSSDPEFPAFELIDYGF